MEHIGKQIRQIRKSKNLSQQELAEIIGIDRAQYSRVETGKVKPTLTSLEKIAEALQVEIIEFFKTDSNYDISSYDKSLVEKVKLIEQLDEKEKKSIFNLVDTAVANKKYTDFFKKQIND